MISLLPQRCQADALARDIYDDFCVTPCDGITSEVVRGYSLCYCCAATIRLMERFIDNLFKDMGGQHEADRHGEHGDGAVPQQ